MADPDYFLDELRSVVSALVADGELPAIVLSKEITHDTRIGDLGADSLAKASILAALLDRVDGSISEAALEDSTTVGSLAQSVAYENGELDETRSP
jgi:acyl carrier protein